MSGSNKKNDIIIKNMHIYVCFWFLLGQEWSKANEAKENNVKSLEK